MAASLNKIMLIGRMGQDAELKYTTKGTAIATISVATSESWKKPDGTKEDKSEWHRCVAFGRIAEVIGEYGKKGMLVFVEGRLTSREYDGKDGVTRKIWEVVAHTFSILSSSKGSSSGDNRQANRPPSSTQNNDPDFVPEVDDDDDIRM